MKATAYRHINKDYDLYHFVYLLSTLGHKMKILQSKFSFNFSIDGVCDIISSCCDNKQEDLPYCHYVFFGRGYLIFCEGKNTFFWAKTKTAKFTFVMCFWEAISLLFVV